MNDINKIFKIGDGGLSDTDSLPLYRQIINSISDAIAEKRLGSNDRLPPEPELMKLFGVSRVTLRSAMQELEKQGLLVRIQGKGTFVNSAPYKVFYNKYYGFVDSCRKMGKDGRIQFLSSDHVSPPEGTCDFFENCGEKILLTKRVLFIDESPAVFEYIYWAGGVLPADLDISSMTEASPFKVLADRQLLSRVGARFEFSVDFPSPEEQKALNISPKTPLLVTNDRYYKLPGNTPLLIHLQKANTQIISLFWDRAIDLSQDSVPLESGWNGL